MVLTKDAVRLCRRENDEVMEWIVFLNLHADVLFNIIWGDKDTYRLAFHLAGRSRNFAQALIFHPPSFHLPADTTNAPSTMHTPIFLASQT